MSSKRFKTRSSLANILQSTNYINFKHFGNKVDSIYHKILLKTLSKYNFSIRTFYIMKVNQIFHHHSSLNIQYEEFLLQIDQEDFLKKWYRTEKSTFILPHLINIYLANFILLPNYLCQGYIYKIILNSLNMKQKAIYNHDNRKKHEDKEKDISHYHNKSISNQNDSMEYYNSLNLNQINQSNEGGYGHAGYGRGCSRYYHLKEITDRDYNKLHLSINKRKEKEMNSIDSVDNFLMYLNKIISTAVPFSNNFIGIQPRKRQCANVASYSHQKFTNRKINKDFVHKVALIEKEKPRIVLKKKIRFEHSPQTKFIATQVFFETQKRKEDNLFTFSNDTIEFAKKIKTVSSKHVTLLKNTNSSRKNCKIVSSPIKTYGNDNATICINEREIEIDREHVQLPSLKTPKGVLGKSKGHFKAISHSSNIGRVKGHNKTVEYKNDEIDQSNKYKQDSTIKHIRWCSESNMNMSSTLTGCSTGKKKKIKKREMIIMNSNSNSNSNNHMIKNLKSLIKGTLQKMVTKGYKRFKGNDNKIYNNQKRLFI